MAEKAKAKGRTAGKPAVSSRAGAKVKASAADGQAACAPAPDKVRQAFLQLGRQLSQASTLQEMSDTIVEAADFLLTWDACYLDVYLHRGGQLQTLVMWDTVDGQRTRLEGLCDLPLTDIQRRTFEEGPQLILRKSPEQGTVPTVSFGGPTQHSLSIMTVPVRSKDATLGIFSIQSYRAKAYTRKDLELLQGLVDYFSGGLSRALVEARSRERDRFLDMVLEQAPMVMWTTNERLEVTKIVGPILGKLGIDPNAAVGRPIGDLLDGGNRKQLVAGAHRLALFGQGGALTVEVGGRALHCNVSPVRDAVGKVVGCVGVAHDETERNRGERLRGAFAMLGEKLAELNDAKDAANVVLQTAGQLFRWESAVVALVADEPGVMRILCKYDTIDGEMKDYSDENELSPISTLGQQILSHGARLILRPEKATRAEEGLLTFGNRSTISASLMFAPLRRDNKAFGFVTIQSYTPNAYTEGDLVLLQSLADYGSGALQRTFDRERLRESEEKYRLLVENVNDGIVISQGGRFVFFNGRFAEMLGYTPDELKMFDYRGVHTPRAMEILEERAAKRERGETVPPRYETYFRRKDGTDLAIEASITIIEYMGTPATFAVIRDITERKAAEAEIYRSNSLYEALINASEDYIFVLDRNMRYTHVNRTAEKRFKSGASTRLGKTYYDLLSKDLADYYTGFVRQVFETGQAVRYHDSAILHGKFISTETVLSPILGQDGTVEGVVGVSRDNTQHYLAEQALKESEERYSLAVSGANDGIWDWNMKTNRVYYSSRWKAMLGYSEEEIGHSIDDWFSRICPDDLDRLQRDLHLHFDGVTPHFESEHRMLHQNGSFRWVLTRGLCVRDDMGTPTRMAGSQSDVTVRKAAEEELKHGAFHDPLTGLPNRTFFTESLAHVMGRARRRPGYLFGVLFLDLDRFKLVNDSLGHLIGDQLLIGIARRLETCIRPGDTVARLGGDEFTVLLDDIYDVTDASSAAERVLAQLSLPFDLGGHEVFTTASIGIALCSGNYDTPDDLLRDADTAMYRAKSQGKARYEVFDRSMHEHAVAALETETDLRHAIERREFFLQYQPIVTLKTGRVDCVETLLRWKRPGRGLVPLAEFRPVAVETGLIVPIDWWVLEDAVSQVAQWQTSVPQAANLCVCVNLSPKHFAQQDLIERIALIMQKHRLAPSSLALEITEGVILEHESSLVDLMGKLKLLTVQLHVDDFGTGYSSLALLHRFPIDVLKIDSSFIARMCSGGKDMEIVHAIVALAHSLNMKVVAEGVETAEQLRILETMNCDMAQGYYFSRPVESDVMAALLAEPVR